MAETVSTRLPKDLLEALDEVSTLAKLPRSQLLREVIDRGLAAKRLEVALHQYREGLISLGRAARVADLPLSLFLEEMERHGTSLNYGVAELEDDLDWSAEAP